MSDRRAPRLNLLTGSILTALAAPSVGSAATIVVDGTTCTLANAIISANNDFSVGGCTAGDGMDVLELQADVNTTTPLPIINTDMRIVGDPAMPPMVAGGMLVRPFFVGSPGLAPTVVFESIQVRDGRAEGGNGGHGGGGGAGLGGCLFIYDGDVTLFNVLMRDCVAIGGNGSSTPGNTFGGGGGGGMRGDGGSAGINGPGGGGVSNNFGSGGGGGGSHAFNGGFGGGEGGAGGVVGGSLPADGVIFGAGAGGGAGAATTGGIGQSGANGDFGGGGGGGGGGLGGSDQPGNGGNGGFGAGGGAGGSGDGMGGNGGLGGFGAAGGAGGTSELGPGAGGGGGDFAGFSEAMNSGAGAGLGGAVFIRAGILTIEFGTYALSSASGGTSSALEGGGLGKGGAIAALDVLNNENGNNQGFPAQLPLVTGCGANLSSNNATSQGGTDLDNDHTYAVSETDLRAVCVDIFADSFEDP